MLKKFNQKEFIKKMVELSPRQLKGETATRLLITSVLKEFDLEFQLQKFSLDIPSFGKSYLRVDGKDLEASPCSFVGGKINSNYNLISSLYPSRVGRDFANINFNPRSQAISKSNHYFAPSFAIRRGDVARVIKAECVEGLVAVKKTRHSTANILVGNTINPENICFAHYDSIGPGAIDNASGVAVLLKIVIENRGLLKNSLFVFSACEELSYDLPVYCGHGFRVFEKKCFEQVRKSSKLIVVDCVGNGETEVISDAKILISAFPIKNLEKMIDKIFFVTGDFDDLMKVYHSDLDDGRRLKKKFLIQAEKVVLSHLV